MHNEFKVIAYGNFLQNEKDPFELMVQRNALNYGYNKSQVLFTDSPERIMEILG